MKNLYFLISLLLCLVSVTELSAQFPTGYGVSSATNNDDECIHEVSVGTFVNNSSCNGATAAAWPAANGLPASNPNMYANYTSGNLTVPILTPGSTNTYSIKTGYEATNSWAYTHGYSVFIDYNRNGTFDLPTEKVGGTTAQISASTGCNFITSNGSFTVPNNISVGLTLMRFVCTESVTAPTPTGTYGWGETEDYKVFLGIKKWDYTMNTILGPDSISFCAQTPQSMSVSFSNIENQPIPGGRVDLYIKDTAAGGTTNMFYSKAFTQTIMPNTSGDVTFDPIVFPKDELLKFTFVIYHPLDINNSNDTLTKYIRVYKNPTFTLKADTVCKDSLTTVFISNQSKPVFVKWDNESILDTTKMLLAQNRPISVQVSRGWKCNMTVTIPGVIKQPPVLTVPNDTTLCYGQKTLLTASMNMGGFFKWESPSTSVLSPSIMTDTSGIYKVVATGSNLCKSEKSVHVKFAFPPTYTKVNDTVCLGEQASLGLNNNAAGFLYKWQGLSENTPIIHPTPTTNGQKYFVQWWYQGCTSYDTTLPVVVNPLPNVTLTKPGPICPFTSATMSVGGAKNYIWNNGLGTNSTQTVTPLTTTVYMVKGIDSHGCSKELSHTLYVYPRPDMAVYSNKYKDNICLGDSATVFISGGRTYQWAHGSTDSVLKVIPSTSFQWNAIGTDGNGCKDTVDFRMVVKPAFKPTILEKGFGCEGLRDTLMLSGGKSYDWGQLKKLTDSSAEITMGATTAYKVRVISPEDCQVEIDIPVTVLSKPVPQVSDLTVCSNTQGELQANGGVSYTWSGATPDVTDNSKASFTGVSTTDVYVTVYNAAGCFDVAKTTVKVINTDSFPIAFKSPKDTYYCPNIPITMVATPMGGVWSGTGVSGNVFNPNNLSGTVQLMYTYLDPINGCKIERVKKVEIVRKCSNSIGDMDGSKIWSVYPNPFGEKLTVKIESSRNEDATIYLYDLTGRAIVSKEVALRLGENLIELNELQLAKGTYYIELQTETVSRQAKIMAE